MVSGLDLNSDETFINYLKNDFWCHILIFTYIFSSCKIMCIYNSTYSSEEAKQGPALKELVLYARDKKQVHTK